jgi:hypothetical protein
MECLQESESKKEQYNVRMEVELQEKLGEWGARVGLTGNQFAAEALRRYGDIICDPGDLLVQVKGATPPEMRKSKKGTGK